jgi:uncharacterized SAM-dependent methyltransferase
MGNPSTFASVTVHSSQYPETVRRQFIDGLRQRRIPSKFLYDSPKLTQKWLALHQRYSPSRNDAQCRQLYTESFVTAVRDADTGRDRVQLIGLGCGGGQKETRLLSRLKAAGRQTGYYPCDVSLAMVLTALQAAMDVIPADDCFPVVLDLDGIDSLNGLFDRVAGTAAARIVTFFGMLPNCDPDMVLSKLSRLLRPGDQLILSANLAPVEDRKEAIARVLPLYDNQRTRAWLMAFLGDLGFEQADGQLEFGIEQDRDETGSWSIVAEFKLALDRSLDLDDDRFVFQKGERLRIFFSRRYSPHQVETLLGWHQLKPVNRWITDSHEEGIYLCRKAFPGMEP